MVEIESSQEILIGLPSAAVLSGNESWDKLHDLTCPQNGSALNFLLTHTALSSRFSAPDQILGPSQRNNRFEIDDIFMFIVFFRTSNPKGRQEE